MLPAGEGQGQDGVRHSQHGVGMVEGVMGCRDWCGDTGTRYREMEGWRNRGGEMEGGEIRYGEVEGCRHQLWGWRNAGMRYEAVGVRHRDTDGCRDKLWGWRDAGSRYEKKGCGDKREMEGSIWRDRDIERWSNAGTSVGWRDQGPPVGVEG